MDLRDYEAAKFELAEILRMIAASETDRPDSFEALTRGLFARLAEDRFNLVVVGRFNRGKTSLMNAILGMDRLPTGIVPLTSVISRVVYGSSEQVQLTFNRGGLPLVVPIERLTDYVTERGNPGNKQDIAEARIELPAEVLRRGFHFIDTPGLGSAITANTRTTEAFLPEADAVLMVSGYDSPLSEEELDLLRRLARPHLRTFVIINKQDLVPAAAREEVLCFVRKQLHTAVRNCVPDVFSVSARDGLIAKLKRDRAQLQASGLADMEGALIRFLTQDKSNALLAGIAVRLLELSNAVSDASARSSVRKRLHEMQRRLTTPGDANRIAATASEADAADQTAAAVNECSICVSVIDRAFEFLQEYQYRLSTSARERERFTERRGFCDWHLRQYASLASSRGLCLALAPLLSQLARQLTEARTSKVSSRANPLESWQRDPQCELCEVQSAAEEAGINQCLAHAGHDLKQGRPVALSLCLPHLRQLTLRSNGSGLLDRLLQAQATSAERLAEDSRRYVLKRDALRRGLTNDEEERSAQLALAMLASHRQVLVRDKG